MARIRTAEAAYLGGENAGKDVATRFPVVVKSETRRWLDAQVNAVGPSLAQVAGLILDSLAAESIKQSESRGKRK